MMSGDTIRVYFVTGTGIVSATIRGACMGFPASHTGMILPDDRWISAHHQDGVQLRVEKDEQPWEYFALVTIPCSPEQSLLHTRWCLLQIGKKYDMPAIFAMAEGAFSGHDLASGWSGEWICSTFAVESLAQAGFFPWRPANLRTTTPRDLFWGLSNVAGAQLTFRAPT